MRSSVTPASAPVLSLLELPAESRLWKNASNSVALPTITLPTAAWPSSGILSKPRATSTALQLWSPCILQQFGVQDCSLVLAHNLIHSSLTSNTSSGINLPTTMVFVPGQVPMLTLRPASISRPPTQDFTKSPTLNSGTNAMADTTQEPEPSVWPPWWLVSVRFRLPIRIRHQQVQTTVLVFAPILLCPPVGTPAKQAAVAINGITQTHAR